VHGRTLGALHAQLHRIAPPAGLAEHPLGGDAIVHLDLHPGNVLLSSGGPVVIDWTNVRRGLAEVDVAVTWILMGAFERERPAPTGPVHHRAVGAVGGWAEPWIRRRLVKAFLASSGMASAARAVLASTAQIRLDDRNVRPGEARAIRALVGREAPGAT